jgi:hypothetical protein
MSKSKPYWASVAPSDISNEILDKVEKYYTYLTQSGRLELYRRSWGYYYRPRLVGSRLNNVGEQGELSSISVNHYRNLLLHLEILTTQQRACFEPKATNTDVKSQSQVILASALLDYYLRDKKMERNIIQAVKDCLIFAEGFVRAEWDPTSGKEYGQTTTGAIKYDGDLKYTNYTPLNVIRDYTKECAGQDDWHIMRDFQNKYTLAAKFPDLEDDILSDSLDPLEIAKSSTLSSIDLEDSDNVAVYTLIHKPTPALPQGRYTTVLDNGTVMLDGPLPYKETHVYRIAPDEETGTIFGYTVGYDLLPVQESIDILYGTVVTNQSTFGVQNILVPKGHDLSTSQISGGLNLMEFDPKVGKPEALNLTSTPPEIFNFIRQLEQLAETLSGVDSVSRGNPEASLKSGSALALVQSMSVQFSMGLQRSYAQLIEDLGTGTINILKEFASVPRVAAIAGKSNRPLMKEFTGQDLAQINRVTVDMGNPMTRTTAGKINLADAYMQNGMIENPDQYIQVVSTGRLEPVIEGKQAQNLLIKGENEGLSEGRPQRALATDNHQKHILEHSVVLSNPEIRQDPNNPIVAITLSHIQEHIALMNDPSIAQLSSLLHQEPLPPMAPSPVPAQAMSNQNPVMAEAAQVNQPNAPSPPPGTTAGPAAIIEGNKV